MKTIAVLTSGGDAPGMNAAVRSITRAALFNGMKVFGILKGYNGMMNNNMRELHVRDVSGILERGGTVLYSARCKEFNSEAGVRRAVEICRENGIEGVAICGGDGSFRGARDLSMAGLPCVGVPCTIDNDISSSEYSIGFDTAVNTVVENIDRLRDTSQSHDRCSVIEVMGRQCGDIALHSAICCGAVSVLVPELPIDLERDVIMKMRHTLKTGKSHFIVIVAEGVNQLLNGGNGMTTPELAEYIEGQTGVETRATIIGHVQRGGRPTGRDRVIAAQMGHYAVELLRQGIGNQVVFMRNSKVSHMEICEALSMKKTISHELVRVANEISI